MEYKELEFDEAIKFTPMSDKLGRAEFEFCLCYRRGYVRDIYISPRQQADIKNGYHISIPANYKISQHDVSSYCGDIYGANHWRSAFCKKHKCVCEMWYVPNGSTILRVVTHCGNRVSFEFSV